MAIQGTHDPAFEPLARAFAELLGSPPYGGAALTVYLGGRVAFDMWGGHRDAIGNPWEAHTPAVSYSTTKGVAATALHIARDRGLVDYDAPVARYWPEFAQNGKSTITVRQILTHAAGLHDVRALVEHAEVLLDWNATVSALAKAAPSHTPGRFTAYHALTYGHLVGEIVHRASGTPFSRFIHEAIAHPLGLTDFFVGAPAEACARAARNLKPEGASKGARAGDPRRSLREQRAARRERAERVAKWLRRLGLPMNPQRTFSALTPRGIEHWDFSSPEVLSACIPAANGLFSGRDLARMYAALALGGAIDGQRILSEATVREATRIQTLRPDGVLVIPMGWRLGYHSVLSQLGPVRGAFGHAGYNGSGAWASPRHAMGFGFVVNAGLGTPVGDRRLLKLSSVALACARSRKRRTA